MSTKATPTVFQHVQSANAHTAGRVATRLGALVAVVWITAPAAGQGFITLSDLIQQPNQSLPALIKGIDPGPGGHDQYIVANEAILDGRLDLILLDGFQPQSGDRLDLIIANTMVGRFRSHFFPSPLDPQIAVEFIQTDELFSAQFVDPQQGNDFIGTTSVANWFNRNNWAAGRAPTSSEIIFLQSNIGGQPQNVVIAPPDQGGAVAAAHRLVIDGDPDNQQRVALTVLGGAALSVTDRTFVNPGGRVELLGGELVTNELFVRGEGELFMDNGRIVSGPNSTVVQGAMTGSGDVEGALRIVEGGVLSPGVGGEEGLISVDGDYEQTPGAMIEFDLFSPSTGSSDMLVVSGETELSGSLMVDVSATGGLAPGESIEIIEASAGTIGPDDRFDDFEVVGLAAGGYAAPVYAATSVSMAGFLAGDMNRDGVIDETDVDFFVLGLRSRSEYESFVLPDMSVIGISADITGDVDGDFDLDFDDIDDMIALLPPSAVGYANRVLLGVPEPGSLALLIAVSLALAIGRRR